MKIDRLDVPAELRGFDTYIVAYSGGKDSTAALLWALNVLPRERLRVVHNPTGADWPDAESYFPYIEAKLGITVEHVRAGDRPLPSGSRERATWASATDLFDLIRGRGRWPSFWQRYCTKYLKAWPLRLYAAGCENPVLIMGERAEESNRRAALPQFGPDPFHGGKAYRRPVCRPVLYWSAAAVWEYLAGHGILPNPVYKYADRCGCWCCPLVSRPDRIFNFCRRYPEVAQRWADLEQEIGHTWRHRQSIGGILARARAQAALFTQEPRFAGAGGLSTDNGRSAGETPFRPPAGRKGFG